MNNLPEGNLGGNVGAVRVRIKHICPAIAAVGHMMRTTVQPYGCYATRALWSTGRNARNQCEPQPIRFILIFCKKYIF